MALCLLCQRDRELRMSHVLPKFLGDYLKTTGATGFLVEVDEEGRSWRAQDLFKTELLCSDCEVLLSKSEGFFAQHVFQPFQAGNLKTIPIDDRLARFAISVSLRSLWVMRMIRDPVAEEFRDTLTVLEGKWRQFLLGDPNVNMPDLTHHVVLCSEGLLAHGLQAHPDLILNMLRSSAFFITKEFNKTFFFANLAGVQIISMVSQANLPVAQGTQVFPKQEFGVARPGIGWGGYFSTLIRLNDKLNDSKTRLTPGQKQRVDKSMFTERALKSEDARLQFLQIQILGKPPTPPDSEPLK